MMFLLSLLQGSQGTTPDTSTGLLIGYALMVGLGILYVISLIIRNYNLKRDREVLEHLRDEE